jgi:hypothetical protein
MLTAMRSMQEEWHASVWHALNVIFTFLDH